MATVSKPRESLASDRTRPSPPVSQTSSVIGSPESRPTTQNGIGAVPSTENLNGTAAPPSEPQKLPPGAASAEKPSMTKRLTRMFSTKDGIRPENGISSQPASGSSSPKQDAPTASASTQRPTPPVRKPSSTDKAARLDKGDKSEKATTAPTKEKKPAVQTHQRYVVNPDVQGGHEHHLKSAKRQEKLSDMLRGMLSGRKNGEHEAGWTENCH